MEITLNVTAGELSRLIPESRRNSISSLKLIGSIKGEDIELIRKMCAAYYTGDHRSEVGSLRHLDLTQCQIVEGGIYKHTDFMGHYRGKIEEFLYKRMDYEEWAGSGFGLNFARNNIISNEMFLYCNSLREIRLPSDITSIGDLAFYGCCNLERVYMGSRIQQIGDFAFANIDKISEIHIRTTNPPTINQYSFGKYGDYKKKIKLYVPYGSQSSYWLQWEFDNVIEGQ